MPAHVVVLGGGFAGLRAAVALADAGIRVTVLEARNSLGGRARSFTDPATGEVVDNGQHLFLAGYHRTLAFLDRLGTRQHLLFQDRLKVSFAQPGGGISTLDCPPAPAPWHLFLGMLLLGGIPMQEKLKLRRVWRELNSGENHRGPDPERADPKRFDPSLLETVEQWLSRLGQGEQIRSTFWHPLTLAAINEQPEVACAVGLKRVLRTLMMEPWPNARLGMAAVGLSDLYAAASRRIIEEKGGAVWVNSPAAQLEIEAGRVKGVRLANGSTLAADAVVSALPPRALSRIVPEPVKQRDPALRNLGCFASSPIISVNLWLDRPVVRDPFIGLIGARFQWLFNKPAILRAGEKANYLSLILSAAGRFIDEPNEVLVKIAWEDLTGCLPQAQQARVLRSQVVREREATVSLTVGAEQCRPGPRAGIENLFLAGDWTATGLPATIESAVASGEAAARAAVR